MQRGSAGSSFSPCGCDFQPAIATFAKQMPSSESVPGLFERVFLEFSTTGGCCNRGKLYLTGGAPIITKKKSDKTYGTQKNMQQ